MKTMQMKDINKLAKLVKENELTRLQLKDGEFELSIEKEIAVGASPVVTPPTHMAQAESSASASTQVADTPEKDGRDALVEIVSPIVGTFYRSSSPESDPYVNVGSDVQEESVVCIVEAMKVMNEIHAETSGVIREILVDNATPVQFGQPLFLVEPR